MANFGRRTWDRDEYALLAQGEPLRHEEVLKNTLSDVKLQHLKTKYTDHHGLIKESMHNLNKKVLATGINSYKKGKQFGFYCELCDLTFKDTAQYIDHLNHKTHQIQFESIFGEKLVKDVRDNDAISLDEFKKEYKAIVQRFVRKHDANAKSASTNKTKSKQAAGLKAEANSHPTILETSMGFKSFGTTKN